MNVSCVHARFSYIIEYKSTDFPCHRKVVLNMDAHITRFTDKGDLETWIAVDIPDDTLIAWVHRVPPEFETSNTWIVYGSIPATMTTQLSDDAFALWRSWLTGMMRDTWPGPGRPKQYVQRAHTIASKTAEKERERAQKPVRVARELKEDPEWARFLKELSESRSEQN
jgi:hypothetical protein